MSDNVLVNQQHIQEGVSDLMQAKKSMVELKESMTQSLGKRLDSWQDGGEGAAPKQAYQEVLRVWDQSMQDMENIAQNMSKSLGDIGENYQNNERRTASNWGA